MMDMDDDGLRTARFDDRLIVVFGGGGFVGRAMCETLLARGARVRIAQRHPVAAASIRALGNLGMTQFVRADVRDPASVVRAVAGAHGVVNLVGVFAKDIQRVHVTGARNVAEAAAEAGATALVQVSAIGADAASDVTYARTKGGGEAAVREAFPRATILRPSVVFGREDKFVNLFADLIRRLPIVPVVAPNARFQPVYVGDVAEAATRALLRPDRFAGGTFELGGPETITMERLFERVGAWTARARRFLPIPDEVTAIGVKAARFLPFAPLSEDQFKMLQRPNIVSDGADGLEAFGIAPTPLEAAAPEWLTRHRRAGRFTPRDVVRGGR